MENKPYKRTINIPKIEVSKDAQFILLLLSFQKYKDQYRELSMKPKIKAERYEALEKKAAELGYNLNDINTISNFIESGGVVY